MRRYRIIRAVARPFLKVFFRYKLEGKENIPDDTFVLVANHVAQRDPFCLACTFKEPIRFVAKTELNKGPVGWLLRQLNVIYINRDQADLGAIRQCVSTLKEGTSVGIFPQGTRVHEKAEASQTNDGVSLICNLGKMQALPVALIYKSGRPKLFSRCRVVVGKPIPLEEILAAGDRSEQSRYIFGKVCELIDND